MDAQVVIIHDTRLAGSPPKSHVSVIEVNAKTPLASMVQQLNNIAWQYGGEVRVRILCHGYEDQQGHGGYGLQLCAEDLTLNTVNQLQPLNGNIDYYIKIYSCGTADVAPGRTGQIGDGRELCSRIARVTGAGVFAADATQYYTNGTLFGLISKPIDFGNWEGNVLEFDAGGTFAGSTHAPADTVHPGP